MATWISVEDDLPKMGKPVLVWGCDENPIVAFRIVGERSDYIWFSYDDNASVRNNLVGITHWMPLPDAP